MDRLEIAENIAEKMAGKVWAPKGADGIVRVYVGKGYCQVENDGVNIDKIKRQDFDTIKNSCMVLGLDSYRA